MAIQRQLGFEILRERASTKYFGGALLKNSNPKVKRPVATKKAMHLVMKSTQAKAELSLLRKERVIYRMAYCLGKKLGVKIYRLANGGNHLHLIIRPSSRVAYTAFIRSFAGLVVREIYGSERGTTRSSHTNLVKTDAGKANLSYKNNDKLRARSFWDFRPFTRIIEWGRAFKNVCAYLDQNALEAWGFTPYRPRRSIDRPEKHSAFF